MIDRSSSDDEVRWAVFDCARRGEWAGWADARVEWHRRLGARRQEQFELCDRDIDYVAEVEQCRIVQGMDSYTRLHASNEQVRLPF